MGSSLMAFKASPRDVSCFSFLTLPKVSWVLTMGLGWLDLCCLLSNGGLKTSLSQMARSLISMYGSSSWDSLHPTSLLSRSLVKTLVFNAHPQRIFCIEVDLSCDLKETIYIYVGDHTFTQKVLSLNLPSSCYQCQSGDHKIRDCLLVMPSKSAPSKDSHAKPAKNGKKDHWTISLCKGKTSFLPKQPASSSTQPFLEMVPVITIAIPIMLVPPPISNLSS